MAQRNGAGMKIGVTVHLPADLAFSVFGIASALEGYCVSNMNIVIRVLMAVGGLLLIHPAFITDVIGFVIVGVCMVIQYMIAKKAVVAS